MPEIEKAPRRRVEWPPGDPKHVRYDWAQKARQYSKLKRRPIVVELIAAMANFMNAEYGYA